MKVLLIWEMIPDSTEAFLIENPTEEQLSILIAANGKVVGSDDTTPEMNILTMAVCNNAEWCDDSVDEKWHCLWSECKVEFPVSGPIDLVVWSGFVC